MQERITHLDFGGGMVPLLTIHDTNNENICISVRLRPELRASRDIVGFYHLKWTEIPVTARGVSWSWIVNKSLNSSAPICEVWPGFSWRLMAISSGSSCKPIIIDPAPYEVFETLITRCIEILEYPPASINWSKIHRTNYLLKLAKQIQENIAFYMNPESVGRYQWTFRDIVTQNPELHWILEEPPYMSFSADYYDSIDWKQDPSLGKLIRMMMKGKK